MMLSSAHALVLYLCLVSAGAGHSPRVAWIWTPTVNNHRTPAGCHTWRSYACHLSKCDAFDPFQFAVKLPLSTCSRRRYSVNILNASGTIEKEAESPKSLFIFGVGYVATAVALTLLSKGWAVHGTCTDPRKVKSLEEQGIKAYIFDDWSGPMLQPEPLAALTSATCILSTVPPTLQSGTDPVLVAHEAELKWAHQSGSLKWVGYMSSTGVYGDRGGGWVTEEDEPGPSVPRTKARLKAESAWLRLHAKEGLPVHVFRLAGIYGPGRSALDSVARHNGDIRLAGADDGTMISRIHAADIVGVLEASIEQPDPGIVVNVADDLPSTRYETLAYGCKLMGFPRQDPDPTESYVNRRGGGNKRVDNTKMRALLEASGRSLVFPDYRAGLRALHEGDGRPFAQESTKDSASSSPSAPSSFAGKGSINAVGPQDVLHFQSEIRSLSRQISGLETKMNELLAAVGSESAVVGTEARGRSLSSSRGDFEGEKEGDGQASINSSTDNDDVTSITVDQDKASAVDEYCSLVALQYLRCHSPYVKNLPINSGST
ncbi:unnamed protein product [Ascophyllum nodosum]